MSDTDKARKADEGTVDAVDVVDAVFVIGTGSKNNNEELKYALRNLERNCPFVRDVYISGECPSWVDTSVVKHLKWPDRFRHAKDANIIDKLRHACEQPDIAKRILFCSDDQFQTRECTWEDFEPRWLRQYRSSDKWYEDRHRVWHTRLRKTLERDRLRRVEAGLNQDEVYYYQPHIWMPIDRDKFIDYAVWSDYEHRDDTIIASGYFNFVNAGGRQNFDHVFISPGQKWPVNSTHIAYTDSSFDAAMRYLKKEYPYPSRFEVGGAKPNKSNKADKPEKAEEHPEGGQAVVVSASSPSPHPESRDDVSIIRDFTEKINANKVWHGLRQEVETAEKLREADFNGWRRVWNDIIRRWNTTTDKGSLYIPVTIKPSAEAAAVVERFKNDEALGKAGGKGNAASSGGAAARVSAVAGSGFVPATVKKCTKCEERRRRAEEARRMAQADPGAKPGGAAEEEAEAAGGNSSRQPSGGHTAAQGRWHPARSVKSLEEIPPMYQPRPASAHKMPPARQDEPGCVECAIDHLAVAVAYLGSNVGRPDALELALAKGEVQLAAQHLLALKRMEEYNICAEVLDSVYSAASRFSAATFKDILKRLTDG